jgi:O-acetyl-ADP-ribose deacetylase (regulator of RNase III)
MRTRVLFSVSQLYRSNADAIVHPTDTELSLATGLGGELREHGGPRFEEECARIVPVRLGHAVATPAGMLRAFFVIHAVARPEGGDATLESIRLSLREALLRAEEKAIKTLAIPAFVSAHDTIPLADCAHVMLEEVLRHRQMVSSVESITIVVPDAASQQVFQETWQALAAHSLSGAA